MFSQIFCYWDKQQSAESNMTQFHLTLKCTKDQSSHFCDCVLVTKWIFQHHDRGLTTFHAESEQLLMCIVINNSTFPTVKNNNTAYHAFGKYWIQGRGLQNYRLKYCWLDVIYCKCQPNELEQEIKKKTGGQAGSQAKIWGSIAHPGPTLESPLIVNQSRNPLGTPGVAKSFLRWAQIFQTISSSFKLCRTDFPGGGRKVLPGSFRPPAPPGYRPVVNTDILAGNAARQWLMIAAKPRSFI